MLPEVETLFKALGEPHRLRIYGALGQAEELCACQLVELLGLAGATVSRHLAILQDAQLLVSRKQGRWVYYSRCPLPKTFRPVLDWLDQRLDEESDLEADKAKIAEILDSSPEDLCRRQRGEDCCPPSAATLKEHHV